MSKWKELENLLRVIKRCTPIYVLYYIPISIIILRAYIDAIVFQWLLYIHIEKHLGFCVKGIILLLRAVCYCIIIYIYIRIASVELNFIFSSTTIVCCVINRSLESNSYNKASELQEEICAKKLEWRMAQLHLAAVKAQVRKRFLLKNCCSSSNR